MLSGKIKIEWFHSIRIQLLKDLQPVGWNVDKFESIPTILDLKCALEKHLQYLQTVDTEEIPQLTMEEVESVLKDSNSKDPYQLDYKELILYGLNHVDQNVLLLLYPVEQFH